MVNYAALGANRRLSTSVSIPAPTKGWVTIENQAAMPPDSALDLVNVFPNADSVEVRGGFTSHATGMTGTIGTLFSYSGGSSNKMLAANDGKIYDVTSSGAVGSALATGFASNNWQYVNFSNGSTTNILMVNGSDDPQKYDGSAISANAITGSGLTDNNLINLNVFKGRLFFIEKATMNVWFLPLYTLAGAASKLDLSPFARKGGELIAMGTWTRDGGNGADDFAVFITSKGEMLIYEGSDPSSPTDWGLVGVFDVAPPIGYRCFEKFGSDMVILTRIGVLPLSAIQTRDISNLATAAVSKNIENYFRDTAASYGSNTGWQIISYPQKGCILINVPTTTGNAVQFVANSTTGAWCRFEDQNSASWAVHENNLYFGGYSGVIYKADTGTDDNGDYINWDIKYAFNYFGDGSQKKFQMIRPVWRSNATLDYTYRVNADFDDTSPSFVSQIGSNGTTWGSPWGSSWSPVSRISQKWNGATGIGRCASAWLRGQTKNISARLQSIDWILEPAGIL